MFKLRNYAWIFILATGILAVVSIKVCRKGNAANKTTNITNVFNDNNSLALVNGGVIILNDRTFAETIKKGVTLVDFWATWCRPCKMQAPIIEEVSSQMSGKATIGKLDVDQNPDVSRKYNVQSIPTMIIFKDGKVVSQFMGLTSKEEIVAEINKYLK
jgi:thioredoxin 1